MPSYAVEISDLTICFGKRLVLWNVNVAIEQGVLVGIIGPNGAGKSTLLKGALSLVPVISGKVLFFGKHYEKMKKKIAYVPQKDSIDWEFPATVFDVALMGRYPFLRGLKWSRKADREAAEYVLHKLDLLECKHRQISELSGGQQQRLFLARALLQEPELFILDEPFTGVDATTEKLVIQLLKDLRDKGKTILMVHHDLTTAKEYFDRILLLNTSVIKYGDVQEGLSTDFLQKTYGKEGMLLEEATKRSNQKTMGLR